MLLLQRCALATGAVYRAIVTMVLSSTTCVLLVWARSSKCSKTVSDNDHAQALLLYVYAQG